MARPRPDDFIYGAKEVQQLIVDAAAIRDAGAHGVVYGVLSRDGTIDDEAVTSIEQLCSGIDTVFHRAFDSTPDPREALDTLVSCGLTRVLTSGHAVTAAGGVAALATLNAQAARQIQILPGGGIRAHNVAEIVRRTGVTQIHARGTEPGVIAGIRAALQEANG